MGNPSSSKTNAGLNTRVANVPSESPNQASAILRVSSCPQNDRAPPRANASRKVSTPTSSTDTRHPRTNVSGKVLPIKTASTAIPPQRLPPHRRAPEAKRAPDLGAW